MSQESYKPPLFLSVSSAFILFLVASEVSFAEDADLFSSADFNFNDEGWAEEGNCRVFLHQNENGTYKVFDINTFLPQKVEEYPSAFFSDEELARELNIKSDDLDSNFEQLSGENVEKYLNMLKKKCVRIYTS